MRIQPNISPILIKSPYYSLSITKETKTWNIRGEIKNVPLHTGSLPFTYTILEKYVPQILLSSCFNDDKLPFSEELYNTELSHLLEHILLEFLCEEKLKNGEFQAVFDGMTTWYRDSPEKFLICIHTTTRDEKYFNGALPKGLQVFDLILQSPQLAQRKMGDVSDAKPYFLSTSQNVPKLFTIAMS